MEIRPLSELVTEAFKELKKIQDGDKRLVKTGFDFIDDHINGLLVGDTVILSGLSGHGKSETLFRLRDNIMDININPDANDFIWCNFNLEVKMFNVLLRSLNRKLNKKKQDILFNPFTEDEKDIVRVFNSDLKDDRQLVCQNNITAEEFYIGCKELLEKNKHKSAVFISFDHAALIRNKDKTKGIEELIGYINQLKLEYHNCYFFVISQLNRQILGRVQDKNNNAAPNAGDLYASSSMDFVSSYNIVVFDAYKLGINQFMKVSSDRYDYLSDHFGDEDQNDKVSFSTEGKLFYKIIKTRESDVSWKDLYIIDKDLNEEEKKVIEKKESKTSSLFSTPIFENETIPVPNFDMAAAFGDPEEEDKEETPF